MNAKSLVHSSAKQILPAPMYWRFLAWRMGYFDIELELLQLLCDKRRVSLDIGASIGSYAAHILTHSSKCIAFEPRPDAAAYISERLTTRPNERLQVEAVALSDQTGETKLRILTDEAGRSTLESNNPIERIGEVSEVTVPMRRLDDYESIDPIGFIKIDVEGHEEAVLRGARERLKRDRPSLLIEIEERHKPGSVKSITKLMGDLGFSGFFYREGQLHSIESFDAQVHQDVANIIGNINRGNMYVNNFIFLSNDSLAKVQDLLAANKES